MGFTLVEVVIALSMVTVGLLALASTSGLITRMIGQGHRLTEVGALAHQQLEQLQVAPCPNPGAGVIGLGRSTVHWSVTVGRAGVGRQAVVVIVSPDVGGVRGDTFTSILTC